MNMTSNQNGFTLLELIMVMAIVGLMAVGVAPQFVNVQVEAQSAREQAMIANIIDGINLQFADRLLNHGEAKFPSELDNAANAPCSTANPCFSNVLKTPLTDHWIKTSTNTYMNIDTNIHYYYTFADGTFDPNP